MHRFNLKLPYKKRLGSEMVLDTGVYGVSAWLIEYENSLNVVEGCLNLNKKA